MQIRIQAKIYIYIYIFFFCVYAYTDEYVRVFECIWPIVRKCSGKPGLKDVKTVLDASLLNTQHYKVRSLVSGANQGKK